MKKAVLAAFCCLALTACGSLGSSRAPMNFILFFSDGSTDLTPEARAIVTQAADAIKSLKPATVTIATGVAAAGNLPLAAPRFEAIQKALVDAGVEPAIIARAPLADPKENVTAVANRRAEIQFFQNK